MKFKSKITLFSVTSAFLATAIVTSVVVPNTRINTSQTLTNNNIKQNATAKINSSVSSDENNDISTLAYAPAISPTFNQFTKKTLGSLSQYFSYDLEWDFNKNGSNILKNILYKELGNLFTGKQVYQVFNNTNAFKIYDVEVMGENDVTVVFGSYNASQYGPYTLKLTGFATSNSAKAVANYNSSDNRRYTYFSANNTNHSNKFASDAYDELAKYQNITIFPKTNAKMFNDLIASLKNYSYFGLLPSSIDNFSITIRGLEANNCDGTLKIDIVISHYLSSSFKLQSWDEKSNFASITVKGFRTGITEIEKSAVQINEFPGFKGKSLLDLGNECKSTPATLNVVKEKIADLLVIVQIPGTNKIRNFYSAKDIQIKSSDVDITQVGGGVLRFSVTVDKFYSADRTIQKQFIFEITGAPIKDIIITQTNTYPAFLSPQEIERKIREEINTKNNFSEQVFIQSFINITGVLAKDCKIQKAWFEQRSPGTIWISFELNVFSKGNQWAEFTYSLISKDINSYVEPKGCSEKDGGKLDPIYIKDFSKLPPVYFYGDPEDPQDKNVKIPIPENSIPYVVQIGYGNEEFLKQVIYDHTINRPGPINSQTGEVDDSVFSVNDIHVAVANRFQLSENLGRFSVTFDKWIQNNTYTNKPGAYWQYAWMGGFHNVLYTSPAGRTDYFDRQVPQDAKSRRYKDFTAKEIINYYKTATKETQWAIIKDLVLFNYWILADENGEIYNNYDNYTFKTLYINNGGQFVPKIRPGNIDSSIIIEFQLPYTSYYTGDRDYSVNVKDSPIYKVELNMFNSNIQRTYLTKNIFVDDKAFNKYYAQKFWELINTVNPKNDYDVLTAIIKKEIIEKNWILFVPQFDGIDNNILMNQYMKIEIDHNLQTQPYQNDPSYYDFSQTDTRFYPSVDIVLKMGIYYDDNGEPVKVDPNNPNDTRWKEFPFRLYADFKLIEPTRIQNNLIIPVDGVSNIKPGDWFSQHSSDWQNYLTPAFINYVNTNPSSIIGTYPNLKPTYENLEQYFKFTPLDSPYILTDNSRGSIETKCSLTNYYNVQDTVDSNGKRTYKSTLISPTQANEEPYTPDTTIIFTGFLQNGLTTLPFPEYPAPTNPFDLTSKFPSDFATVPTDPTCTLEVLQNFIYDKITGEKTQITPNDIEINVVNKYGINYYGEPNDKLGTLTLNIRLKKMWVKNTKNNKTELCIFDSNNNPQPGFTVENPNINKATVTIKDMNKRDPTSLSSTEIDLSKNIKYNNKFAQNLTIEDMETIIEDNTFGPYLPIKKPSTNPNDPTFKIDYDTRVFDNLTGTVSVNVHFYEYYHSGDALLVNKNKYPNQQSLDYTVKFKGLKHSQPTEFIFKDPVNIFEFGPTPEAQLIAKRFPSDINKNIATDPTLQQAFKKFIFDNIVVSGKDDLTFNDVNAISCTKFSNRNGEIRIKFQLDRYWDRDGRFIDISKDVSSNPLKWEITITGLNAISGETIIGDNNIDASKSQILSPMYALTFYQSITNLSNSQQIIDEAKKLIFEKCVTGNKEGLTYNDVEIMGATKPTDNESNCKVQFRLKRYYKIDPQTGDFYLEEITPSQEYVANFYKFTSNSKTTIISVETTLIGKKYNENGGIFGEPLNPSNNAQIEANCDLSNKLPSEWRDELIASNNNVEKQLADYARYNYMTDGFILNPPTSISTFEVIESIPKDELGQYWFRLKIGPVLDSSGSIDPNQPYVSSAADTFIKVGGFASLTPTDFSADEVLRIDGDLSKIVIDNSILSSSVRLENNNTVSPANINGVLQQFLFDKLVIGYKGSVKYPLQRPLITKDNIVINAITEQNKFDGTLKVEFTLNAYYGIDPTDPNSIVYIDKQFNKTKIVKLDGFSKLSNNNPDTNLNTIFLQEADITKDVPNKLVDANNKPLYYASEVETAIKNNDPDMQSKLSDFVFKNLIKGDKQELDDPIYNPLQISITSSNDKTGELEISFKLPYYWENNLITPGTYKTAKIIGFKVKQTTEIHDHQFNLVSQQDGINDLPSYPASKDSSGKDILSSEEIIKIIKTKNITEFKKWLKDPSDVDHIHENSFQYYIKELLVKNRLQFINSLPQKYINPTIQDLETFKKQLEIDLASETFINESNSLSYNVNLYNYLNNGVEIGPKNETNLNVKPISARITFVGFKSLNIQETTVVSDITIDVSKDVNKDPKPTNGVVWNQKLFTQFKNGEKYYWAQSIASHLRQDIVNSKFNSDKNITNKNFNDTFWYTIKQWIYNNAISNVPDEMGQESFQKEFIIVDDYEKVIANANDTKGIIPEINFWVTKINAKDETGKIVEKQVSKEQTPIKGKIRLIGFEKLAINLDANSTIPYWVIGGISLAILCIVIIILIFIYRKRKDIEYNK